MDYDKELESDPDWLRAKAEAERKDPNYWSKETLAQIEVHLRYSMPTFKFFGFVICVLLALILWRLW